jgi:hypothetical protein
MGELVGGRALKGVYRSGWAGVVEERGQIFGKTVLADQKDSRRKRATYSRALLASQSSTTPLTSPFPLSPCSPPLLLYSSSSYGVRNSCVHYNNQGLDLWSWLSVLLPCVRMYPQAFLLSGLWASLYYGG